jgi:hypothetical protein
MVLRNKTLSEPAGTVLVGMLSVVLFFGHPQIKGWVSGFYDVNVNCNQGLVFDFADKIRFCSMYAYARFYTPPAGSIGISNIMQFPYKLNDLELFYMRMGVTLFF